MKIMKRVSPSYYSLIRYTLNYSLCLQDRGTTIWNTATFLSCHVLIRKRDYYFGFRKQRHDKGCTNKIQQATVSQFLLLQSLIHLLLINKIKGKNPMSSALWMVGFGVKEIHKIGMFPLDFERILPRDLTSIMFSIPLEVPVLLLSFSFFYLALGLIGQLLSGNISWQLTDRKRTLSLMSGVM